MIDDLKKEKRKTPMINGPSSSLPREAWEDEGLGGWHPRIQEYWALTAGRAEWEEELPQVRCYRKGSSLRLAAASPK